jgi:hypothetical protein
VAVSADDVDECLRAVGESRHGTLQTLRRTILEVVPEAEQVIYCRVTAFRCTVRPSPALPRFDVI